MKRVFSVYFFDDDGQFVLHARLPREIGAVVREALETAVAAATYRGFEDSLRDYLQEHEPGLSITPETSRCGWRGETMDYSQAIEAMQFLEQKAGDVAAPRATSTIAS